MVETSNFILLLSIVLYVFTKLRFKFHSVLLDAVRPHMRCHYQSVGSCCRLQAVLCAFMRNAKKQIQKTMQKSCFRLFVFMEDDDRARWTTSRTMPFTLRNDTLQISLKHQQVF